MLPINYSKLQHCGCGWKCRVCLWLMDIVVDNLSQIQDNPASSFPPSIIPTYPVSAATSTSTQQELLSASPSMVDTNSMQAAYHPDPQSSSVSNYQPTPRLFANGLPLLSPELTNKGNTTVCPTCMETSSDRCSCFGKAKQQPSMSDIESLAGFFPASSPQFLSDNKNLSEGGAAMNDMSNPSISSADIVHWLGDTNMQHTSESFSGMSDNQQATSPKKMRGMPIMSQSPLVKPVEGKTTRRKELSPESRIISKTKKARFTSYVQRGLKRYILNISDHPYIDSDKAVELGKQFAITNLQVLNWFRLARTRKFTRELKDGEEIWTPKPKAFRGLM